MKCKECKYFTGTQCHGHGEFFGECNLKYNLYKSLPKELKKHFWLTDIICYEDTECNVLKERE